MAKKMVNGYPVVKRWSGGLILSSFLTLLLIFIPIVTFFIGFIANSKGVATGLDYIKILFLNKEISNSAKDTIFEFSTSIKHVLNGAPNAIFNIITYGEGILILIPVVFSIILFFFFLVPLLSGRYHKWKAPSVCSWIMFVLAILQSIIPLIFTLVYSAGTTGKVDFSIIVYHAINISISLIISIVLCIVYAVAFKGRYYIKDAERLVPLTSNGTNNNLAGYPSQSFAVPGSTININPYPFYPNMGANEYPNPYSQMNQPLPQETTNSNQAEVKNKFRTKTDVKHAVAKGLPPSISSLGGHAFAQNINLENAFIPEGINEIGPGCFANCINLAAVSIPLSVKKIGYNAFFNCRSLVRINYGGTKLDWKKILRGSNWLSNAGTYVVCCVDGLISVNPLK